MILEVYKFKAHFTAGLMKGMIMDQDMTFGGEAEVYDWAYRVNKNNRVGECPFWVSDIEYVGEKEVAA